MHLYAPVPSPCDRDASIPTELGDVVRKAMSKRAEERFASMAEMRQAFLAAMDGPALAASGGDDLLEMDELLPAPPARRVSAPLPRVNPTEPAKRQRVECGGEQP